MGKQHKQTIEQFSSKCDLATGNLKKFGIDKNGYCFTSDGNCWNNVVDNSEIDVFNDSMHFWLFFELLVS